MGRNQQVAGGRPVVVATRISLVEAEDLDRMRGALSRGEYLRWLFIRERKAQKL